MPYVYIVRCTDDSFYVGNTVDLARRLSEHNSADRGPRYTRRRRPVALEHSVWFDRIDEAFRFETQVHGWGRAKRQAWIDGRYDDLPALSRRRAGRSRDPGPPEGEERAQRATKP